MKDNKMLTYLSKVHVFESRIFDMYFNYFDKQKDLDELSLDEKVVLAGYLLDIDVTLSKGKYLGYPGKKSQLLDYYQSNIKYASDEALELLSEHVDRQKDYEKKLQEREVKEKYPDIYNELIELRKVVNKNKTYKIKK